VGRLAELVQYRTEAQRVRGNPAYPRGLPKAL